MVGNDIIDLSWARRETNWRRKGYLEKVFTGHEQQLIQASTNPSCTIWQLWSMKESAYKLFIQTGQDRFYNPHRLRCEINTQEEGGVHIDDFRVHTTTVNNSKYIFTSASPAGIQYEIADHIHYLAKTDLRFQSRFTHGQLLHYIARRFDRDRNRLEIKKTEQNVPVVFFGGVKLNVSVSLTHHGNYGAYSVHLD